MSVSCPACSGSGGADIASWADWEAAAQNRPDGAMRLEAAEIAGVAATSPALWRCEDCASVSMRPPPSADQLDAFYQNYHAVDSFLAKADKKVARARRRIRALSFLTKGRRFLDAGASIGAAAEAARQLGFEATAVEIDRIAVNHGMRLYPDIEFVNGVVGDVESSRIFDVIYAAEIIEHLIDPAEFARQIHRRLAPGGVLFLTTPDAGHFRRPKNLLDWKSVKPPEHVTLFTRKGLRALFEEAGLEKIFFKPHLKPGVRMIARRR